VLASGPAWELVPLGSRGIRPPHGRFVPKLPVRPQDENRGVAGACYVDLGPGGAKIVTGGAWISRHDVTTSFDLLCAMGGTILAPTRGTDPTAKFIANFSPCRTDWILGWGAISASADERVVVEGPVRHHAASWEGRRHLCRWIGFHRMRLDRDRFVSSR
jgi:hypothetical protein